MTRVGLCEIGRDPIDHGKINECFSRLAKRGSCKNKNVDKVEECVDGRRKAEDDTHTQTQHIPKRALTPAFVPFPYDGSYCVSESYGETFGIFGLSAALTGVFMTRWTCHRAIETP